MIHVVKKNKKANQGKGRCFMTQVNNNTTLIGRLVRDIEGAYVKEGELFIGTITLAVDRRGKDAGADFIRCKFIGNHWEKVANYLNKGTQIAIAGHIQTSSYEDKEGNRHFTTDVIVDNLELLGKPRGEQEQPKEEPKKAPAKRQWKKK